MKILFYRYGSICEPDILNAFAEVGFEVSEMSNEIFKKDLEPAESVQLISQYFMDHPTDVAFSINFFPYLSEVCNIFHVPYLCWVVDSPVLELYATSIKNPCNRVFLFDRALYEEIHPLNPDCVFHLPLAVDTSHKQKVIKEATPSLRQHFHSDISFVGSLYTEKCPYDKVRSTNQHMLGYLDGLMYAQSKVYGYYFIEECLPEQIVEDYKKDCSGFYHFPAESYLKDSTTLAQQYMGPKITSMERLEVMRRLSAQHQVDIYTGSNTASLPRINNRGFAKTLTEMPIIFHESQINLNITAKAIRSGISLRCFDILGCEGFMLSNYQPELLEHFEPGEDMDVYTSMEDLEEKVAYYMTHPSLCKEIAHNGYEKILLYHTYPIRIAQMFSMAFPSIADAIKE